MALPLGPGEPSFSPAAPAVSPGSHLHRFPDVKMLLSQRAQDAQQGGSWTMGLISERLQATGPRDFVPGEVLGLLLTCTRASGRVPRAMGNRGQGWRGLCGLQCL